MIYDMSRVFFSPSNLLKQVILISLRFFTAVFNVSKQNGSSFLFSIYKLSVDSVHIHFVKLCLVHLFRVNIKSLFYFAVLKIYFQCYFHVSTRKSSKIHAKYICGQVNWCFFFGNDYNHQVRKPYGTAFYIQAGQTENEMNNLIDRIDWLRWNLINTYKTKQNKRINCNPLFNDFVDVKQ